MARNMREDPGNFVSASRLTRWFRERLGVSLHAFLLQVRIKRAAELWKTQKESVALVAQEGGYKNASHFVRDFRQRFGAAAGKMRSD
jgi:transcriptional regulator GlxA family with amidase domain